MNVELWLKRHLEDTAEFAGLLIALMAKRRRAVPTTLNMKRSKIAVVRTENVRKII